MLTNIIRNPLIQVKRPSFYLTEITVGYHLNRWRR